MEPTDPSSAADPPGEAASIWLETTPETSYGALRDGLDVDTVVVGGGVVGVTTAFELATAGQSVALVERDRLLEGVTGNTTAKLTSLHGLRYRYLVDHFGRAAAEQYADANETAIDVIEATVRERGIDCEFERVPAYTYARSPAERRDVRAEVEVARSLDLPASYVETTPLPFEVDAAVRFDDQASVHPRKYLLSLARALQGEDCFVFEETTATDVDPGEPCRVRTDRGTLVADDVVVATNFPFFDHALYFARLFPKRSYVLAVRLESEVPEGLFYHPGDPYFSVRPRPAGDEQLVLVGGQNHQTGEGGSTQRRYRALAAQARARFDVESIEYRWSTQDYVAVDRVPFIGRHAPSAEHVFVATGFGGWGLTNGTAGARLLADLVLGRENPWEDVFRPTRLAPRASARRLASHNADAAKRFLAGRLERPSDAGKHDLQPDEARVVSSDDGPVGVYRDPDGNLHAVSLVCPHLGCRVEWNDGERSWDCPCHGSRFDYDGRVLHTPAVEDLDSYPIEDLPR